ncbi:hypothetical protein Hanom_Chr05g00452721 [Helianthus anomalus]
MYKHLKHFQSKRSKWAYFIAASKFETVKPSKLVFKFSFGARFCYSVGLGVSKLQIVPNSFVYGITDKAKQVQIVNLTEAKPLVTYSLELGFG